MKIIRIALPALAIVALSAGKAAAQDQEVSFEVQAINQISFSGSPSLVISTATAGSAPTSANANATYAITTNETNRKITAQLDSDMPTGTTLSVTLAAPNGATSTTVQLSESAQDVVTGVSKVSESGLNVSYSLTATAAAGVIAADSRTITYTIATGA